MGDAEGDQGRCVRVRAIGFSNMLIKRLSNARPHFLRVSGCRHFSYWKRGIAVVNFLWAVFLVTARSL